MAKTKANDPITGLFSIWLQAEVPDRDGLGHLVDHVLVKQITSQLFV